MVDDDGWIFVSGSTGTDPVTMTLPDGVVEQCANTLATIAAALAEAGASFDDVRRVRYIVPDRADFEPCWPQLRAAFGVATPAATMIVAGLIDPRMRIEIEVTARLIFHPGEGRDPRTRTAAIMRPGLRRDDRRGS